MYWEFIFRGDRENTTGQIFNSKTIKKNKYISIKQGLQKINKGICRGFR